MLILPPSVRIFAAAGATELRLGFDGLAGRVRAVLQRDPRSGALFLFANARRTRVRVIYFDGTGLAVACERLELQAQLTAAAPPLTVRYTPEDRDRFNVTVCRRIARAVQSAQNARERRMAEREAIFAELEERGLIERTRGGARVPIPKAEVIS